MLNKNQEKNISLGILIPTRNRAIYLSELLSKMIPQSKDLNIKIYIRDNNSSDETENIIKKFQELSTSIIYNKNIINIGADPNFMLLVNSCQEDYFWIFGDDEILENNGLNKLMEILQENPDYVVLGKKNFIYKGFNEYINDNFINNPYNLIDSTLITANIVKREIFDLDFATTKYATHYVHMYGIMKGLSKKNKVKIVETNKSIFKNRGINRASPVDGDWPENLKEEWYKYLRWLSLITGIKYPNILIKKLYIKKKIRKFKELIYSS